MNYLSALQYRILILFFAIVMVVFSLLVDSIETLAITSFMFFLALVVISYLRDYKLRLMDVWHLAFIYVIVSEMLQNHRELANHQYGLSASRYLVIGSCMVLIGYLAVASSSLSVAQSGCRLRHGITFRKNSFTTLCLASLTFFLYAVPLALQTIFMGRSAELNIGSIGDLVFKNMLLGVGMVLPAFIAHHLNNSIFGGFKKALMYIGCVLVILVFIMMGTRYYVLFSLGGFVIVKYTKVLTGVDKRKILYIFLAVVAFVFSINEIKDIRAFGYENVVSLDSGYSTGSAFELIASKMSPEGVVKMDANLLHYFETREHMYGASSGFLLYFWIPRSMWPDKPVMIGYWLVREYDEGFAEGHSASVGFFGDLYADFGLFVFPLLTLLGVAIAIIEKKVFRNLVNGGSQIIMAAMFFPAIFFFVRSPMTTMISLVGIYIAYRCLCLLLFPIYRKAEKGAGRQTLSRYFN